MTRSVFAAFLLWVSALGGPAVAQIEMPPETTNEISTAEYIQQAAVGDLLAVESSTLALQKGQAEAVKAFARKMVDDHTQAMQKLQQAALSENVKTPFPTALDEKHQRMLDRLKAASGKDFDRLYLEMQFEGHQRALQLHTDYRRTGTSKPLQAVALEVRPIIQSHIAQLREMIRK